MQVSHLAWDPKDVRIAVVACFHMLPTRMEYVYLHWSKLDQCNYEKIYLEFNFNVHNLDIGVL